MNNKHLVGNSQKKYAVVPIDRAQPEIARPLPHNLEAERSILGAILLDDSALAAASGKVGAEDFFGDANRIIFHQMCDMSRRGFPVDMVLLIEELRANEKLESAGGAGYVSDLPTGLPRISNISHYLDIVKMKSQLRQAAHLGYTLEQRALDPDAQPTDLVSIIRQLGTVIETPDARVDSSLRILDLPEAALDGRLGEICATRLAELPLAYGWVSLVAAAGTMVPPSPNVRTNLFACPIGPPGSGKSQSISRAISVMGVTKPNLEATLAGSFEGLAEKLDVNGEARLLSPDELGHLLTKSKIDGASFPFVLNTAYYKSQFDVTAARGKKIHVNCSLGILGGIVEEHFSDLFGNATTGGLFDRFILGRCPQPFQYAYRPFEGGAENIEPCAVIIAGDVWDLRDEMLRRIGGLTPRIAEHAIRVSVIAAAYSGRSILYAKHVEIPARAFAEYQIRMRAAFKPNPGENTDARCAFAILTALADNPGWNLKRDVSKKIHSERYGPCALERALNALTAAGDIEVCGRPARLRTVGV